MRHPSLISLELSTRCPNARLHPRCPASLKVGKPESMPTDLVLRLFQDMAEIDYAGEVMFSIYNEPTADMRMMWLWERLAEIVPNAKLRLLISSEQVDEDNLADFLRYPSRHRWVNAYTPAEVARMKYIGADKHFRIDEMRPHDDRMCRYDREPHGAELRPCTQVAEHLPIYANGALSVCCYDWQRRHVIADMHAVTIRQVLESEHYNDVCDRMAAGERPFHMCKRCFFESKEGAI